MGPTASGLRRPTPPTRPNLATAAPGRAPANGRLCPALSPLCAQMLLGRRTAARVDVNMPPRASHSACFAMFVACLDTLLASLRVMTPCLLHARPCVMLC